MARRRTGAVSSPPLPTGDEKTARVRAMFDTIAPRYDLINRLMTFGLDQAWRRNTVAALALPADALVLDLACGTGDLSRLALRRGYRVIGSDLSAGMLRANAYATSKAALEAHTINLAAELAGTGVTVNAFRPGSVDTAMQTWIREQDPDRIGTALHTRFNQSFTEGALITPERSAAALIAHLAGDDSGSIWDVSDASARV